MREEWKKLSPEERESRVKEWRKTNATFRTEGEKRRELRHMSPEERAAKRKEIKGRLEKRIAELRARQAAGALTPQDKRELERREQVLKRFETDPAPRVERPRPQLTNAPKRILN
jgi:ribosomal protein L29